MSATSGKGNFLCSNCKHAPRRCENAYLCVECHATQRDRRNAARRARHGRKRPEGGRKYKGDLIAWPLAQVLHRYIDAQGLIGEEVIQARTGVSSRQINAWDYGEVHSVSLDTADRVMLHIEALWWEIWTPEHGMDAYAKAALLFGDEVIATDDAESVAA